MNWKGLKTSIRPAVDKYNNTQVAKISEYVLGKKSLKNECVPQMVYCIQIYFWLL